jgi:branched-chain amino acid transport system ATP-binding protein
MADPAVTLRLKDVSKTFGIVNVVDSISFDVKAGESVGLVGPNGAGKTTLFNCVCGQLQNDHGAVYFEDHPLNGMPTYRRARLGIGRTYQRTEVFPDMTVRNHLLVAERVHSGTGRLWKDLLNMSKPTKEENEVSDRVMDLVGLMELADTPVAALGLGHCRLVELARALAGEPTLLLADEPSSGLDERETAAMSAVLRTVQRERGTAILLVEHDLEMVSEVVDRVVVMDLGSKVAEGTFDEVMANPAVRYAYLGESA